MRTRARVTIFAAAVAVGISGAGALAASAASTTPSPFCYKASTRAVTYYPGACPSGTSRISLPTATAITAPAPASGLRVIEKTITVDQHTPTTPVVVSLPAGSWFQDSGYKVLGEPIPEEEGAFKVNPIKADANKPVTSATFTIQPNTLVQGTSRQVRLWVFVLVP